MAYVLAPELFTVKRGATRVITEGISRGQTILAPEEKKFPPSAWDDMPIQQGCVGVDADGVLALYLETLTAG